MVSRPGNPGGGLSESFSARVCGAWSVAKQSITSRFCQRASTSSFAPPSADGPRYGRDVRVEMAGISSLDKKQMMRTNFTRHFDAAFLGGLDEQNFLFQ